MDSIAAGGDGIGRVDGLAVFVPRTAPGELVEAEVRQTGRFGRGRLLRVVDPSPERVQPRCAHYEGDRCGGCQLQHLSAAAQQEARRRIVHDAFARIARLEVDVPPVVAGPSDWGYRSRLSLALRRTGRRWVMGLHSFEQPERVFDLHECPITDDRVVAGWVAVRSAAHMLPRAAALRGTVRLAGNDIALVIEGGAEWREARAFAESVPSMAVIRWQPDSGSARVIVDRRTGGTPEESFDQVNRAVAGAARLEVVSRALAGDPRTAIDAYAGLGATASALAERGVGVRAVEVDARAARYLAGRLPEGSSAIAGRVEDVIGDLLPADVVILNPPRAGIDARVATALVSSPLAAKILYMSCDPATLARDVARLGAYRVTSVRAYDMFPQTAHVEVVCELVPEES